MVAPGKGAPVPGGRVPSSKNPVGASALDPRPKDAASATVQRGPVASDSKERPPKVVITIHQGGNRGARGHVRVEGAGLYIVKTKLYRDKIR